MKPLIYALTVFLLAGYLPSHAEETGNLLPNPSFEEGPWPGLKDAEIDESGDFAHTGRAAMRLFNRDGRKDWFVFRAVVNEIQPGQIYRYALYAKGEPGLPFKIKIHWSRPGESERVNKLERKLSGDEFDLFEIIVDAPPNATAARLFAENWTAGSDIWIDDVFFGPAN